MALYSKVNSLSYNIRASRSTLTLGPKWLNFLYDLPFPSARETAALSLPSRRFLSNASSKLFSAGANASDVYSSGSRSGFFFFQRPKLGCARLFLGSLRDTKWSTHVALKEIMSSRRRRHH